MRTVDPPPGTATSDQLTPEELRLATRNHGTPLEALGYDLTPVGLHYLLVHYDIPQVDAASWRLRVGGSVRRPLELSLADVRAMPAKTMAVTLECAGNGRSLLTPRPLSQPWGLEAVGTGQWTGTPLGTVLEEAEVDPDALEVVFEGLDRGVEGGTAQYYARSLRLDDDDAMGNALLAYELNGGPLPPQHGFPLRLVVPGWYGMASVKWLGSITLATEPFAGYHQARSYRLRQEPDEPGIPLGRIAVRALMVPPGVPDFFTRRRVVAAGSHALRGRAWSGRGTVTRVEVSEDGGETWGAAEVEEAVGPHAWRSWRYEWAAERLGSHVLCCRATDSSGEVQPLEPRWNLGGYAGNAVQRVPVEVVEED